jgi:hypothetical protein
VSCPNNHPAASPPARLSYDRRPGETPDHWRARLRADRVAVLLDALHGVELSTRDRRIIDWLATWEPDTVETIASLFERIRAAAPSGGSQ